MGYNGDWASHNIEHAVSAVYDIPHAGGLAILFPNWMKHYLKVNPSRFAQMAERVFDVNPAGKTEEEVALKESKIFVNSGRASGTIPLGGL